MGSKVIGWIDRQIKAFDGQLDQWSNTIMTRDREPEQKNGLGFTRNEAFYKIALLFAIFGLVPIFFGAWMFFKEGLPVPGMMQVLIYLAIVYVTVSNKILATSKRIIFVFGYYGLSLMLLIMVGSNGAGLILVISTLAIAGILLNKKQSIGFVVSNILIFMGVTFLLGSGVMKHLGIQAYQGSWLIVAISSQAVGIILMLVIRSIYKNLETQAEYLLISRAMIAESEKHYRQMFDDSGVGISYLTTDGVLVSLNRLAATILGGKPEEFEGKSLYEIFSRVGADRYQKRLAKTIASEEPQKYEDQIIVGADERWFVSTFGTIIDANDKVTGVQIATLDISERKKLEKDLTYSSSHDFLTGLYNRRYFEEQLIRLDREENLPLTIIMADLNGLKLINDSFGHRDGDRLLIGAARALLAGCRRDDTVARIGGDEFAVLLPLADRSIAEEVVGKIVEHVKHEVTEKSVLSISFGHATKEKDDQDMDDVFMEAENQMYKQKIYESSSMRSKAIDVIMNSLYEKSERELYHSKRVGSLCGQIASRMGFSLRRSKRIQLAGLVHDIGKIGVAEKVLNKVGRLDDQEWKEIQNHPEAGWRILSSVHEFSEIANYILDHHERWDGKGYPKGLREEQISLEARIIAVADAFDAMTSQRSYRAPMKIDAAVEEIKKFSGLQFDPTVVEVFVSKFATLTLAVDLTEESNFSSIKLTAQDHLMDE